jgi:hypothetical protein
MFRRCKNNSHYALNRINPANSDSFLDSGATGKIFFGISEPTRNMQFALRFSF